MTEVDESESVVDGLDGCHRLPTAAAEKHIVAALPQVRDCVVVSARLDGRMQTNVVLDLLPGADRDADHEAAVLAALAESGIGPETVHRIYVNGSDRDFPGWELAGHREMLARAQLEEMAGARLLGFGAGADPVPVAVERIRVEFAGDGAGTGELSWGQREIWQAMTRQGNWLPLGGWKPLDPGTSIEDVAEELAYLHHRFPSMRTRLRFDTAGRPTQELAADGVTHLEIFDAPQDADDAAADTLAAAIAAHYEHTPYDLRAEWPVRMAVVRRGNRPTHMVVIMHHLALDAGGGEIMLRDVAVRATEPPTGLQQLELARWQASPAGQKQSQRAMRHVAEVLRTMPVPTFPPSADPRRPRWWSAELESSALRLAVRVLGDRTGADPASVMLALYAVALTRVTGVNPVLLRPVIGNRFRRQLADVVCHTSQAGLLLLDTADATVEEVIRRANAASLTVVKHSYYDPEHLSAMMAAIAHLRGAELDIASFINDRRVAPAPAEDRADDPAGDSADSATMPTAEDFAAARAATRFEFTGRRNEPVERLFLHIDDAPGAVKLTVEADTRALAPAQMEVLIRGVEELAVQAVLHPGS